MNRPMLAIDTTATRLRRVGRLARRRMRIEGAELTNGRHIDGTLTIEISGLGSPVAGIPDSFEREADRPIALLVVRSGLDGEDVAFHVGPSLRGTGRGAQVSDGSGIRSLAFCYNAASESAAVAGPVPAAVPAPVAAPVGAVASRSAIPAPGAVAAAARALAPTGRERRSLLSMILDRPRIGPATS